MEATKAAGRAPVRTSRVAVDFLMLAGVSVIVGLLAAAAVSAVVILLTTAA